MANTNITSSVWRSTLVLSFISCYLMWGMSILVFIFIYRSRKGRHANWLQQLSSWRNGILLSLRRDRIFDLIGYRSESNNSVLSLFCSLVSVFSKDGLQGLVSIVRQPRPNDDGKNGPCIVISFDQGYFSFMLCSRSMPEQSQMQYNAVSHH